MSANAFASAAASASGLISKRSRSTFVMGNMARMRRYFHTPVSIQRSMRRIGSSHSHTIPVTT
jgi:hypothetical protein